MKPDIEALRRLQQLDNRAAELRKEIAALPIHIAEIERKLEAHTRRLEADRGALSANAKKRKGLEDEIRIQEGKISKLNDQMLQAKTNEQYRAFQNEITWCRDEIRKREDEILELMGESEPLERNVGEAEKALAEEKKSVESEKEDARRRTQEDEAALASVGEERNAVAISVAPDLLSLYERMRRRWHGVGIADATEGRCGACQIGLRPQAFQDLRRGERVLTCESCGRILYYNPPVSFEHELHQKV